MYRLGNFEMFVPPLLANNLQPLFPLQIKKPRQKRNAHFFLIDLKIQKLNAKLLHICEMSSLPLPYGRGDEQDSSWKNLDSGCLVRFIEFIS